MENKNKIQKYGVATVIKTFGDDLYIIRDKTPDEVAAMIEGMDEVRMPNGAHINRKAIASMQSYADYTFQVDQKQRHRRGQFIKNGEWNDHQGPIGISAQLERIEGELKKALPTGAKKLKE